MVGRKSKENEERMEEKAKVWQEITKKEWIRYTKLRLKKEKISTKLLETLSCSAYLVRSKTTRNKQLETIGDRLLASSALVFHTIHSFKLCDRYFVCVCVGLKRIIDSVWFLSPKTKTIIILSLSPLLDTCWNLCFVEAN